MTIHQELDSIMGTTTRISRLLSAEGFLEWKYRMKKYIKMKNFKIWRNILKDPVRITTTLENGTIVDKEFEITQMRISRKSRNKRRLLQH